MSINKRELETQLSDQPIDFSKLAGVEYHRFNKGDIIIDIGEEPQFICIMLSGKCKRIKYSEKGNELILQTYSKGALLGGVILYSNLISTSKIIAIKTTSCYRIPKTLFLKLLDSNIWLMKKFLDQVIAEHMTLIVNFNSKQDRRTSNSICRFLLDNAKETSDGNLLVGKIYSNAEISRYIGIHKVTAARIISQLIREGAIERTPNGIVLTDVETLQLYAQNKRSMIY